MWWCELGEVENEGTSHNFSLCHLSVKNYKNGGHLTMFWQNNFAQFFETRCTMWTNNTKMFCHYLPRNPADSNRIWGWCILSWVDLPYSNVNVSTLAEKCCYTTLWNLAFAFCKWAAIIGIVNRKNTKLFCHTIYKTGPILIKFCTYCPEYIWHSEV